MKTLLRIDASLRIEGSHSRALADFFETKWKLNHPNGVVIYRDLNHTPIPHLENQTVQAFYISKKEQNEKHHQILKLSDDLIKELKAADDILISSPLYNLNVPSTLKSYLDHIIRSGVTFHVNKNGNYQGLLKDKSAFIITTKGETYAGTAMEALDFQEPYLKAITSFIGLNLKSIFALEATAHPTILQKNITLQQAKISKELTTI